MAMNQKGPQPSIRSNKDYSNNWVPPKVKYEQEHVTNGGFGYTGNLAKNEGIKSMVEEGTYVINDKQQQFLKKKYGNSWLQIITQMSGTSMEKEIQKPIAEKKQIEVILHGKEITVPKTVGNWIQKKIPVLTKVGESVIKKK